MFVDVELCFYFLIYFCPSIRTKFRFEDLRWCAGAVSLSFSFRLFVSHSIVGWLVGWLAGRFCFVGLAVEKQNKNRKQFHKTFKKNNNKHNNTRLGAYACLVVHFYLSRSFRYYLIQVYLPSIITCVISFLSFWIDHKAVPARISVGLLTVLTITTQTSGKRTSPHTPRLDISPPTTSTTTTTTTTNAEFIDERKREFNF